ncbi:hypothetical protein LGL55_14560 [Clostridium tagluense]|uniref:DUF4179 domain-containing protein n=1 Tax=Clostridium tagluense TaxID=360422 RepID=UPI001CF4B253|nr:hypothetical protein [Clostridium tagluense]MCB2312514.1 hypothetical protein [Clostridium tagluense]MCB2317219.1 hypothetical protein [Clostridium tagluense]MCB2322083.1 hypothetical protein [Clostridium tagluense]MCB2327168.1 hypothetical protein [Clostridium tagluense]MCB2331856.1 hypothetical protein [Clostridium tagluense]
MSNNLDDLKKIYDDIQVPENLSEFVDISLVKGRSRMKKENIKKGWIKGFVASVAVFTVFTISINTMPAFANSLVDVPIVGKLVKVLQFKNGEASGGKITDGTDANSINIKKNASNETIVINFTNNKDNKVTDNVAHFKVDYKSNPTTMTFTINGARALTAEKDFETIKKSSYVSDIYKNMILDDSAVKFTIVFNKPIKYEVKEYKDPARIVIKLTQDKDESTKTVYAVRTLSNEFGENLGIIEDQLFQQLNVRTLKDNKGTFCVEAGVFNTKAEAEAKIKDLATKYGENLKFVVEERGNLEIPKQIK